MSAIRSASSTTTISTSSRSSSPRSIRSVRRPGHATSTSSAATVLLGMTRSPVRSFAVGLGRVDGPETPTGGPEAREHAYPLAESERGTTHTLEVMHASRRHHGAMASLEERPVDATPVHTSELPATPQRDRAIPATAWIEAPDELLALGKDLGHDFVAYIRRIGPWLL